MPDATIDRRPHASDASSARSKRVTGYAVFDPLDQKIGRAEEVFVNWDGEPGYIRIRLGLFGTRSVLIPVQFVETDEKKKTLILKSESIASREAPGLDFQREKEVSPSIGPGYIANPCTHRVPK